MNCKQVRHRLSSYLDDETAPSLREEIARHIDSCGKCRQTLVQLKEFGHTLQDLPIPVAPEDLAAKILARARERLERPRRSTTPARTVLQWWTAQTTALRLASAAALALGLVVGTWMSNDFMGTAAPDGNGLDPAAFYNLDFLADAPSSSLAQVYLALTSSSNDNGGS